jgi:hypothetical protein
MSSGVWGGVHVAPGLVPCKRLFEPQDRFSVGDDSA